MSGAKDLTAGETSDSPVPNGTPDSAAFRAASLLADAWQPALDRSYRLGYGNGYDAGFRAAEQEMADAWARAAKPIRDVLKMPIRGEVA